MVINGAAPADLVSARQLEGRVYRNENVIPMKRGNKPEPEKEPSPEPAREFKKLKEIESQRARQRQVAELKQNKSTVPENFPEREKGDARDLAAAKVGMSKINTKLG